MRIGFFGGTFDPPHRGHLAVAQAAADAFALDRVLLAPVALQPLKSKASAVNFDDRLAMVELLCAHDVRLEASSLDAPRRDGEPNYTVDTLLRLRAQLAADDRLFLLLGADALRDLPRWRRPDELWQLAELVAVSRPGSRVDALVESAIPAAVRSRIHILATVREDVSATEIRARLRAGLPCDAFLLPEVLAYIEAHNLYAARP
jgi:nicotinate-nucleotide adenylyltransferase